MRKIELTEMKELQLDILSSVDCFCKENDIRYSIACGTLLGAIRHKGYIPWDDDIDIYMLREDFNTFENVFPEILSGKFKLASLNRDKNWTLPFAKVYDMRTVVYEKRSKFSNPGINIDIFPIDEVPDDEDKWLSFNKKRRSLFLNMRHANLRISSINSFIKNCAAIFYFFRFLFVTKRKLALKCDEFAQKYNGLGYKRVFETSMGMSMNAPFEKGLFYDLINVPFEDRIFSAFKEYDGYLTCSYGDYLTPPPLNKRQSNHTIDAYWRE